MKSFYSLILLLTFGGSVFAQNTCVQTLKQAQAAYAEGRIAGLVALLEKCLETGFSKEERIEAYKLLTLVHLYANEKILAELAMLRFLRLNPEYELNTAVDPPEFVNLYNQFRTKPIFQIGFRAGANYTFVREILHFSLDNANDRQSRYTPRFGFDAGVNLDFPLTRSVIVSPEINFSQRGFSFSNRILTFATLEYQESQSWLTLPVTLRYQLYRNRFRPYAGTGLSASYLLAANATLERRDFVDEQNQREVSGPAVSMLAQRRRLNLSAVGLVGAGFKNVIGKGVLSLEFRFYYSLTNLARNRLSQDENNRKLVYDYGYLDSDFALNAFSLTAAYTIPKYSPKLLHRTKAAVGQ